MVNDGGNIHNVKGAFILESSLTNQNQGTIVNFPMAEFTIESSGSIANQGTSTFQTSGLVTNHGTIVNSATMRVDTGAVLDSFGSVENHSNFQNEGNILVQSGQFENLNTGSLNNKGEMYIMPNGTFDNQATFFNRVTKVFANGGESYNSGLFENQGKFFNGFSAGQGFFRNEPSGEIELLLGGILKNKRGSTFQNAWVAYFLGGPYRTHPSDWSGPLPQ